MSKSYRSRANQRGELRQFVTDYHNEPERTPFGYVVSMECADAVLDPDNIREWHELGLRAIGITHYGANRRSYRADQRASSSACGGTANHL